MRAFTDARCRRCISENGSAVSFDFSLTYDVYSSSGATVIGTGANTISGGGYGHLGLGANTRVALSAATVTVSGTPAFTTFAAATLSSTLEVYGTTFTGAATGQRYFASNAIIYTGGAGANFFPGNVAGGVNNGGVYA